MSRPTIWVGTIPTVGMYSEGYPVPSESCPHEFYLDFAISSTFSRIEFHPHGQVIVWLIRPVVEYNHESDQHNVVGWEADGSHSYMPYRSPWVHIRGIDGKTEGRFPVCYFDEFPNPPPLELPWPQVYYEIFHWIHFALGAEEAWRVQSAPNDEELDREIAALAKTYPDVHRIIEMRNITDEARKLGYDKCCDLIDAIDDLNAREHALHTLVEHILERIHPVVIPLMIGSTSLMHEEQTTMLFTPLAVKMESETRRLTRESALALFERYVARLAKAKRRPTYYLHDTSIRIAHSASYRPDLNGKPKRQHKTYPFDVAHPVPSDVLLRNWVRVQIVDDVVKPSKRARKELIAELKKYEHQFRFDVYYVPLVVNRADDIHINFHFATHIRKDENIVDDMFNGKPGKFTECIRAVIDLLSGPTDRCHHNIFLATFKKANWARTFDRSIRREMTERKIDLVPVPRTRKAPDDDESSDDESIQRADSVETNLDAFTSCYMINHEGDFRVFKITAVTPATEFDTYTAENFDLFRKYEYTVVHDALIETSMRVCEEDGTPVQDTETMTNLARLHYKAAVRIHYSWPRIPPCVEIETVFRSLDHGAVMTAMELDHKHLFALIEKHPDENTRAARTLLATLVMKRHEVVTEMKFINRAYTDGLKELSRQQHVHVLDVANEDRRKAMIPPRGLDMVSAQRSLCVHSMDMINRLHKKQMEEFTIWRRHGLVITKKAMSVLMSLPLEKLADISNPARYMVLTSKGDLDRHEAAMQADLKAQLAGVYHRAYPNAGK